MDFCVRTFVDPSICGLPLHLVPSGSKHNICILDSPLDPGFCSALWLVVQICGKECQSGRKVTPNMSRLFKQEAWNAPWQAGWTKIRRSVKKRTKMSRFDGSSCNNEQILLGCASTRGSGWKTLLTKWRTVAGLPGSPEDCHIRNQSLTWLHLTCRPGWSGGLGRRPPVTTYQLIAYRVFSWAVFLEWLMVQSTHLCCCRSLLPTTLEICWLLYFNPTAFMAAVR